MDVPFRVSLTVTLQEILVAVSEFSESDYFQVTDTLSMNGNALGGTKTRAELNDCRIFPDHDLWTLHAARARHLKCCNEGHHTDFFG